jgi:hypothetical protein
VSAVRSIISGWLRSRVDYHDAVMFAMPVSCRTSETLSPQELSSGACTHEPVNHACANTFLL